MNYIERGGQDTLEEADKFQGLQDIHADIVQFTNNLLDQLSSAGELVGSSDGSKGNLVNRDRAKVRQIQPS